MAKKKSLRKRVTAKVNKLNKKLRSKVLDIADVSHPGYAAMLRAAEKKKKRK